MSIGLKIYEIENKFDLRLNKLMCKMLGKLINKYGRDKTPDEIYKQANLIEKIQFQIVNKYYKEE